jgi:hypothetical protein
MNKPNVSALNFTTLLGSLSLLRIKLLVSTLVTILLEQHNQKVTKWIAMLDAYSNFTFYEIQERSIIVKLQEGSG